MTPSDSAVSPFRSHRTILPFAWGWLPAASLALTLGSRDPIVFGALGYVQVLLLTIRQLPVRARIAHGVFVGALLLPAAIWNLWLVRH